MKISFNESKLEQMSSKFVIQFYNFMHDAGYEDISIRSINIEHVNDLNQVTTINITSYVKETNENRYHSIRVAHAKDMSCSNWQIKKQSKEQAENLHLKVMLKEAHEFISRGANMHSNKERAELEEKIHRALL